MLLKEQRRDDVFKFGFLKLCQSTKIVVWLSDLHAFIGVMTKLDDMLEGE